MARLGGDQRSAALEALAATEHQVVVVGGGVVGAGIALDAATRGLSVGLVEARDFASGTSSRSSKLIHGGLRYLEQFNFGLVREALIERSLLLRLIAPHLVRPVPFLFPLTHHVWERAYVGAGVGLYDTLALLARRAARAPGAPAPDQEGRAAAGTRAAQVRVHRGGAVLGRAGRRRAVRPHAGPHGGHVTARRWRPAPRWSGSSAKARGSPACAPATWRPVPSLTSARSRW